MHVNGFSSRGSIDHADIEPLVYVEEARSERMLCVLCMEGQIQAMYWWDRERCIMDASGVLLCGDMADPPENLPEINAFCSAVSADFAFMKLELFVGSGQGKLSAVHLWEDAPFFLCARRHLDEELGSMLKIPNA